MTLPTDLTIHRILKAPRALVWRCWTEAELLKPWFVPKPHEVTEAVIDLRPGGRFFTRMRVDGQEYPNDGAFLEIVPEEKLVFTDLILADYLPAERPGLGFTATLTFADHAGGTAYTALARHRTAEDAEKHEAMGFTDGWTTVAAQLDAFAQSLAR